MLSVYSGMVGNDPGGLRVYEAKTAHLLSQMDRLVLLFLTISSTPWLSSNPVTEQCKITSPSSKKVAIMEQERSV